MIKIKKSIGFISGIISIIVLILSILPVMILNPTYDIRINMISLLGVIEGKESFNIGIIIVGFLQIPFFYSLRVYLKERILNKNLITLAFISGIIFSLSQVGVGLFPANLKFGLKHLRVAFFFFNSALFTTFLFSLLLIELKETKGLGYLGLYCSFLIFLFMYFHTPFLEWMLALSIWFWIVVVSCFMIYTYWSKCS